MGVSSQGSCDLTGAQHTLRAGIVRNDRELFHQIIGGLYAFVYF